MKIEVTKAENKTVAVSELEAGRKFRNGTGMLLRQKLDNHLSLMSVMFIEEADGWTCVRSMDPDHEVHPCDSDGQLESVAVEKVRADLPTGSAFIDEDGDLHIICGHPEDGRTKNTIRWHEELKKWLTAGINSAALVTPGHITAIHFTEGTTP